MAKIIDLDLEKFDFDISAIGLGNFDGFHKGHRDIVEKTIEIAKEYNVKSSILLFKQHTNEVFPHFPRYYINSLEDKIEILEEYGVDYIFTINFTYEFAQLTKEEFILDFIRKELNAKYIICGPDYTYGKLSKGTVSDLYKMEKTNDIKVFVEDYTMIKDEKISSTIIRKLLYQGRVSEAYKLLNRPYTIRGNVVHGFKIGSKVLGYPTANIETNFRYILPKEGVYLTNLILKNKKYLSLTSIGTNPTVTDSREIKLETFIIDFDKKIYGEEVKIEFLEWIRDQIKFDSKDELIDQMNKDYQYSLKYKKNLQN
ncbi:bifunctional riboflavin kinase/FAD synthetase [Helcococcus sueciensis]|uniref:bifunctional riboflavin kinase/FAD synthetase n=1 Tax=Helcococcus sueciensis TaxID=241555 RepID=UPI0003FC93BA|nr:bifunctional riboflavin kinase/FAD synthetase [Helcococcus sueciensis]